MHVDQVDGEINGTSSPCSSENGHQNTVCMCVSPQTTTQDVQMQKQLDRLRRVWSRDTLQYTLEQTVLPPCE